MIPSARTRTAVLALAVAAPLALAAPAAADPLAVLGGGSQPEQGQEQQAQQDTRTLGEKALEEAARHEGKPYRYGATGPDSFDCSGFVQYVFGQVGRELPRTSRDQYAASEKVDQRDRQPGDLIAIRGRNGSVTHVGIYAGDDRFWVAPRKGKDVQLQEIYTSRYSVGRFS